MPRRKADSQIMSASGERLSQEMKRRKVTSKELSEAIGINPVQLSYIRTGTRPMSEDLAKKIADYLSDKPIVRGKKDQEEREKKIQEITEEINSLRQKINPDNPDEELIDHIHQLNARKLLITAELCITVTPEALLARTVADFDDSESTAEDDDIERWKAISQILQSCGYELKQAAEVPLLGEKGVDWEDEQWQRAEREYVTILKRDGEEAHYNLTPSEQYVLFSQIYQSTKTVIENFLMAKDVAKHFK